jgi:hypothetical protein
MSAEVLYFYAITRPHSGWDGTQLPQASILPAAPVATLAHNGLLAVVSAVPAALFEPSVLAERLRDAEWARERVLGHHQVLSELLVHHTVLPCAFCTLLDDAASVRDLLLARAPVFEAALDEVGGAHEWGVKISYERVALAEWVSREAPELAALREVVAKMAPGAAYLYRKKMHQAAEQHLPTAVEACIATVHATLASYARAAHSAPVPPQQVSDYDQQVAWSGAYLVAVEQRASFIDAVQQAMEAYAPRGLHVAVTGPWPPYHFAALKEGAPTDAAVALE